MKKFDKTLMLDFGKRVRSLRIAQGHSQQKFAHICDVELSHINRVELGKVNTSISHAKVIADGLGITLKELFDF